MLDFVKISTKSTKRGVVEVFPKFVVGKCSDLMIRGGDFYAIWNESKGVWSTDEQEAIDLIDAEISEYIEKIKGSTEDKLVPLYMWDSDSGSIDSWHKYCQKQQRDNYHELNKSLIFSNVTPKKEDYATMRLPYPLERGPINNYNELISTLYSEEERHKLEWAIGAIVSGDSRTIQKFVVLYGPPGSGKSTVLNIIQQLFDGYCSVFDADILGSASAAFALEQFKSNPMVAICHDADLSHIEKNTTINSLVSHEMMTVNEKHKNLYSMRFMSFLLMGSNKPVKITDSKSGAIRRLIDISPTGAKIARKRYNELLAGIEFELGHIAQYCLDVYLDDPGAYDDYVPKEMMEATNDLFNFIEENEIALRDGISLKSAWTIYKEWTEQARVPYPLSMRDFRLQLKDYYGNYEDRIKIGDEWIRSYYSDFNLSKFENNKRTPTKQIKEEPKESWLIFEEQESKLDKYCTECFAQYANDDEHPTRKWEKVKTRLKDIDTSKLHYLKVPQNLIVIDFDLKDEQGNKSFERNLKEASKWPATYAELSKSGGGIHLHYIYNGTDVTQLSRIYADDIEIKVFTGNSSLRRKLSKCTANDISTISTGLPVREVRKVVNFESIKNEKALRTIIYKNLNKEYMGATKPSMDFILKVLDDAYNSGMKYDVSDLYSTILAFALSSTNQSDYCVGLMSKLHLKSDEPSESIDILDKPIAFFDVEVFPNLFIVVYKELGEDKTPVRLINPSNKEIEAMLTGYRLVGFNCRQYDNHICHARLMNYNNFDLYKLSKAIIDRGEGKFGEAYNLSYTDIYDYSSKKQSLKKWEIELGIHHQEFGHSWDEPVPEELWDEAAGYCENDVIATEAVWNATKEDFRAREILADIADMSVNDTTNSITTRIIFGHEKHPALVYTDLSKLFPGYEFRKEWNEATGKYTYTNWYRDTDLGLGGYVYSEPGMYGNVALIDVESMHPNSALNLDYFGEYTQNFRDLVNIRLNIKHENYDAVRQMFNGKLAKYLEDDSGAAMLSKALKLPINAVYGLTSAKFDNPFRDPRNENNIVALRGALFMRTLQDEVQARGFKVAHIKTDSIKIPDATPEIISFCVEFAKQFGYSFAHEATYERMCLVNDAVYIARYATVEKCEELYGADYVHSEKDICKDNKKHLGEWTATGTQFAVPYVFKRCFSHEPIELGDMCETKQVKTAMYLDMNEANPEEHDYKFIGKVGLFCPIKPGHGGGLLVKEQLKNNGTIGMDSVTGTKGYRWLESEEVFEKDLKDAIDISYYESLVDDAYEAIDTYGDCWWFTSDDPYVGVQLREDGSPNYDINYGQIDNPIKVPYTRKIQK